MVHSRTQSPSYARCDEGLWPNPYSELASDWLVLTPDIVFLPCFCGIRLWIWPEPLVAPRVRRALGTRMIMVLVSLVPVVLNCKREKKSACSTRLGPRCDVTAKGA